MSGENVTDAAADAATPTRSGRPPVQDAHPFSMVTGDRAAMVCEGDVCFLPTTE